MANSTNLDTRFSASLVTASEHVCAVLRERIMLGELKPGDRLVLAAIAEEFGVSPTPVRDALRELERHRLVEGRPMMGFRVVQPDARKIVEFWTLREALECQCARLCARNLAPLQGAELEELARSADEARTAGLPDAEGIMREHAFHGRVAEIANCREITVVLTWIYALLSTFYKPGVITTQNVSHADVVEAIRSGDPDHAERMMRGHVSLTQDDINTIWTYFTTTQKMVPVNA